MLCRMDESPPKALHIRRFRGDDCPHTKSPAAAMPGGALVSSELDLPPAVRRQRREQQ